MKALIMAAGRGSRISDKIDGIPKSVLPLSDGTPIIRHSIINMLEGGIEPVVCVGYKKEMIKEALKGLPVKYYENPFYSITNNIVSLWFARDEFKDEDIMLTSADLYYPKEFLDILKSSKSQLSMMVASDRIDSGDFYFSVDDKGIIKEYGPKTPLEKRNFEYMGITGIRKEKVSEIKNLIEYYIDTEKFDKYFEDMVISLNMIKKEKIDFIDVKGYFWREFDFYEDYQAILEYERGN